ncbi:MAG: anti-sigma factor, partial [Acetobacter sp.]|nr:anti-sigma factor [Acetobacter sp.]
MTQPDHFVTEDDLHAWVDELLSPERLRIVETWLDANPEVRQRVMTWRKERSLLRAALGADLESPVSERFDNLQIHKSKLRYFNAPQMAASIALALSI